MKHFSQEELEDFYLVLFEMEKKGLLQIEWNEEEGDYMAQLTPKGKVINAALEGLET